MALLIARANAQRDHSSLPNKASSDQISGLKHRLDKPNTWVYIAIDQKRIAGLALGHSIGVGTQYLSLLMVEPDYWGKGIASKLINLIVDGSTGKEQLTLWTRIDDNDHARAVYEHKGFMPTGQTRLSKYGEQMEYRRNLQV